MKVLVGIKRVVDYAVKVRVNKGTVELANVKQSMNPFCEVSVECAMVLSVMSVGTFFLSPVPFVVLSLSHAISHLFSCLCINFVSQ
jgi:hypothetical protein